MLAVQWTKSINLIVPFTEMNGDILEDIAVFHAVADCRVVKTARLVRVGIMVNCLYIHC